MVPLMVRLAPFYLEPTNHPGAQLYHSRPFIVEVRAPVQEVSISQAAQLLGVSQATVKRKMRRGDIKGHQEKRPQGYRWLVEVDMDRINHQSTTHPSDDDSTSTGELTTLVTTLQAQVQAQGEELSARRREVAELHQLLAQQHALNAGRRPWWKIW